jgi:hypothetical protein
MPRSSVVGRWAASTDVRIAATIKPENSIARDGCGQPMTPMSTTAAVAIVAKTNKPE